MMTLTVIEQPKAKRFSTKLIVVGLLALALTITWAVLGHRYSSNAIPYQIGTSLFIGGIVWAIAYFGFLRKEPVRHLGRYLFLILFGAAFISSLAMATTPTVMSDMQQDRRDYEHEIAGLNAGLVPGDVAGDPTLAQARFKAQRAVEIVAKYRALATKRLAEAGNPGRNQALVEEDWSYEAQAADLELQMVNLLIANRSKWTVQDDKFTFFDTDLLAKYDAEIHTIREIAKKGDAARNEINGSNAPVAP
jgi:hypothetical protein